MYSKRRKKQWPNKFVRQKRSCNNTEEEYNDTEKIKINLDKTCIDEHRVLTTLPVMTT